MDFDAYLSGVKKGFNKAYKGVEATLDLNTVDKELPPTGIILDNPLLEYAFDRRFMAYGRCYLIYGKKGCSKTTLLFELGKIFQREGGKMIWVETENAPDFDYMRSQGLDPENVIYHNPKSLEEALTLIKTMIENIPKFDPDRKVPIMIALDSIAGAASDYEREQDIIGQTKVGEHAKLMSGFYRHIVPYLESEKAILVVTNQLKEQIGAMTYGAEKPEALVGGEAQRFNSTYQFKVAKIKDILEEDHMGVKRKSGSTHTITVKRNKLGREGNSQKAEFDIYINGGIDWYSPLVKTLGDNYTALVGKTGGWYTWKTPGCLANIVVEGVPTEIEIDTSKKFRDKELGFLIAQSASAKELCRKAFGIPDMPDAETAEAIEVKNKTRRKRKSELEMDLDAES
jgi:recombination protein RecA